MIKQNSKQFADAIDAIEGGSSFSIDHTWDMLSGDDIGNNIGFKTNTASGSPGLSHHNKTFVKEVDAFIKSFEESNGNNR